MRHGVSQGHIPSRGATVRSTKATFVTSAFRVKRFLTWVISKWRTSLLPFMMRRMKTFSRRNDLQLNAVFLRETCHREIFQRNIPDQRLPREACLELGGVKVEKDIVTFNEEGDDTLVEKDLKLNAARGILVQKHS